MSFEDEKELQEFLHPDEEELFFTPAEEDIWGGGVVPTNPSEPVVTKNKKDNGEE